MPVVLYPFRYRDARTGKWVRARYVASREDIAARYAEWEIVGPPEIREAVASTFSPHAQRPSDELPDGDPPKSPIKEASLDMQPAIDNIERFLLALFLRRYVTWCARARDFSSMASAAALYRTLR